MSKDIADYLNRTNFYELLDLKSNCTSEQVKKSYKKLALKFHPDKNKAPGSKEVFSKLSIAYATLFNEQNRKNYDFEQKYKDKPFNKYNGQFKGFNQDSAYNKFRYWQQKQYKFNNKGRQNNEKQKFQSKQQNKNEKQNRKQNDPKNYQHQYYKQNYKPFPKSKSTFQKNCAMIIIVFLFVFFLFTSTSYKTNQPLYKFKSSSIYSYKLSTQLFEVPYYVRNSFFQSKSPQLVKQSIDLTINTKFIIQIVKKCKQALKLRNQFEKLGISHKIGPQRLNYSKKAKQVDLSSCKQISKYNNLNPKYMKEILKVSI